MKIIKALSDSFITMIVIAGVTFVAAVSVIAGFVSKSDKN